MSELSLPCALMLAAPVSAPVAGNDPDKAAIIQAALDYADGFYEGAADRMARAVSPLLTRREGGP